MAVILDYSNGVELRVIRPRPGDVSSGRVRLHPDVMGRLDLRRGDVIEIEGRETTAALAYPSEPDGQDRREDDTTVIRVDGFSRANARLSFGDSVEIRKVTPSRATAVTLELPDETDVGLYPTGSETLTQLHGRPVLIDQYVGVYEAKGTAEQGMALLVSNTVPGTLVSIAENTTVELPNEL